MISLIVISGVILVKLLQTIHSLVYCIRMSIIKPTSQATSRSRRQGKPIRLIRNLHTVTIYKETQVISYFVVENQGSERQQ